MARMIAPDVAPFSWPDWNQMPKVSGIYAIVHLSTGRKYIGSAVNLYHRARHHRNDLRNGVHHSSHLQRAFAKYGEAEFSILVLEFVPARAALVMREQAWIDSARPAFNTAEKAGSILGVRRSQETLAKLRRAARVRAASVEYRAKLSAAAIGKKKSEAHRQALRWAVMGSHHTPETRAKIAAAGTGRKPTPEARARMSAAQRGRYVSPETCARISAAKKGLKPVFTEEARRRKSESLKAAWVKRREREAIA